MSRFNDPQPEECESCGWATVQLTKTDAYARTHGHGPFTPNEDKVWGWLCDVCRSTFAGNAFQYPNQYPDARVLQMIAWQTNYLAAKIAGIHRVLR
jgi:hypothetical protein